MKKIISGNMAVKWKKVIDKRLGDVYNNFCVTQMGGASIFILVEDSVQFCGEILKRLKRRPC